MSQMMIYQTQKMGEKQCFNVFNDDMDTYIKCVEDNEDFFKKESKKLNFKFDYF